MECNVPTDVVFSFTGLRRRGGATGPHADGWGLAFYEGRVARLFLDPSPAAVSPLGTFLETHPIKTLLAIGHVRKRTHGKVSLANTHPFARELWGRHWVFAHNGKVPRAKQRRLGAFRPIGTTDSEHAFCWMLESLRSEFKEYPRKPQDLWEAVAHLGKSLGKDGPFNFLLGDGSHLFARCGTRLSHIIRKAPFGTALLQDEDVSVDFSRVTTPSDRVAVVATVPLTKNEVWCTAAPGDLWVFKRGRLAATLRF